MVVKVKGVAEEKVVVGVFKFRHALWCIRGSIIIGDDSRGGSRGIQSGTKFRNSLHRIHIIWLSIRVGINGSILIENRGQAPRAMTQYLP